MSALEPHTEATSAHSILSRNDESTPVNAVETRTVDKVRDVEHAQSPHTAPDEPASSSQHVSVNAAVWEYALVLTGRLYAVYLVPAELRGELHEGDLVTCESGRGETAGTLIKDVSAIVTAPSALRVRADESNVAGFTLVSRTRSGLDQLLVTGSSPSSTAAEGTLDKSGFSRGESMQASQSACSSPSANAISRTTSANFPTSSPPLYSQRLETGLQMDQYLVRLPHLRRRGVNRDKKRLYFSQRRGTEALECVLQKVEERMLTTHLSVDEVEYQVDFLCATVHLAGHLEESGFSHEQYHRFGQLLLGPLRTQLVEFRHSVACPEQRHRTRVFFTDAVNTRLRELVEEHEKRSMADAHGPPPTRSGESYHSDPLSSSSHSLTRTHASRPQVIPTARMTGNTASTFNQLTSPQPVSYTPSVQMMPVHTSGPAPLFQSAPSLQTVYGPLTAASGTPGLPVFLPQSRPAMSPGQPTHGAHGLTFVGVPHWTHLSPTLIPMTQSPQNDFAPRVVASHPSQSSASLISAGGSVSVPFQSFQQQSSQSSDPTSGSQLMFYCPFSPIAEDSFQTNEASLSSAHRSQLAPQPSAFPQHPYFLTYAAPGNVPQPVQRPPPSGAQPRGYPPH